MWHPIAVFLVAASQDTLAPRPRADTLEAIVVNATRTGAVRSMSQSTLSRADIKRTHFGQDVPIALTGLTGVTASSDAGGFSGYSSLRLRGIDQTRLTISLDGVPLNDPEDQVLYFSNIPDFLNSVQSVRVHRGVGPSGFGTASFGGSLNFESIPIAATPRFAETQITLGDFGTARASLEGASGLDGPWAAYGRVSAQTTNGYRDRSGNDGWSGFWSAGWFGRRDAIKLTGFVGRSKTQLAYVAGSEAELAVNRRFNPMLPTERDDFHQEMVSLQYSRALSTRALLTATAYRNSAAGHYDVGVDASTWNFNLAHVWYGVLTTATWALDRFTLAGGAHLSTYHRDHELFVRPDLTTSVYRNTGFKQEQSGFLKATWTNRAVDLHADLELRRAAFAYRPTAGSTIGRPSIDWLFVNPKLGATWRAADDVAVHLSMGRSSREPTRTDLFAGADNLDETLADELLPLSRVRPETVVDLEAGARWTRPRVDAAVNLFAMRFRNEIAPIGAIALTGNPLRQNVSKSARRGVEVEGGWRPLTNLAFAANATLMDARIDEYLDQPTGRIYRDVASLLSPKILANLSGQWQPSSQLGIDLAVRHVGKSQLANDGDPRWVLPAATTVDAQVSVRLRRVGLRARLLNLLGADAFSSGYTDGTTRYLFPVAGRSLFLTATIGAAR